ncbi:MAG: hypothetical protein WC549_01990 [Actinomycetota bacterium]
MSDNKPKLTEEEMVWIASKMVTKGYTDVEEVHYSDDLNGNEDQTDEVMEFITECIESGTTQFYEKYKAKGYKLY